MRYLIILFLVCCIATSSSAKTVYVNNVAGNDTNTGAMPEIQGGDTGPVRSITKALQLANRGDRIELANTGIPFRESVALQGPNHSGYAFAPFVINGNGATLDGTAPVPADRWEFIQGDLHRFAPARGGYQMLFLNGGPAKQMPRFDSSYVSSYLQPKEWCRCRGGIHFMTEKGKSPYSYDLRYAKEHVGITLYDVQNVVIQNFNIRGYQLDGINAHDNAMDCILADITSVANGRSGIAINGASRVRVVNSEAFDNGETQLRCSDWSTTQLLRSDFFSETSTAWTRHVNNYGNGARLLIDGVLQTELEGWQQTPQRDPTDDGSVGQPDDALGSSDDAPLNLGSEAGESANQEIDDESHDEDPNALDEATPAEGAEEPVNEGGVDLLDDTGDDPFGDLESGDESVEVQDDPFGDF